MIAKLKGRIDTLYSDSLIIDVQGVGYLLSCSQQTLQGLEKGNAATLLVESYMKNEQLALCGFIQEEEQQCFKLLISVQGVGTKVALAILSILKPIQLFQAIAHQDKTLISQAEGIGAKLASRIINELKDKVAANMPSFEGSISPMPQGTFIKDAVSALTNLGYRYGEAVEAISNVTKEHGETTALDILIRKGLQYLNENKR